MIETIKVSPVSLARELSLPIEKVEATTTLLDSGLSVPYILCYCKDQTALEDDDVVKVALLYDKRHKFADRKYSYLKTVSERGELTPELEKLMIEARLPSRLEDLYFPFRAKNDPAPKAAREKGLEPLADAILNAQDSKTPIEKLAEPFVDASKGVATVEDALQGAAEIIAERLSDLFPLRQSVRKYLRQNAFVVSKRAAVSEPSNVATLKSSPPENASTDKQTVEVADDKETKVNADVEKTTADAGEEAKTLGANVEKATPDAGEEAKKPGADVEKATSDAGEEAKKPSADVEKATPDAGEEGEKPGADDETTESDADEERKQSNADAHAQRRARFYSHFFDASFPLYRLTRDQIYTLNRGKKEKILDVSFQFDHDALVEVAKEVAVPQGRAYEEFLTPILVKALDSLLVPTIEADVRTELVNNAAEKALDDVCSALSKRLMLRPVKGRRIIGVDSGFRTASRVAALDENGAVLETDSVCLRGAEERVDAGIERLAELVKKHDVSVIALRCGSNHSRNLDSLIAKLIEEKLADKDVAFINVNDAGCDAYGASPGAVEEFPDFDPFTRVAISLGRRLLDPLAEYVKVSPDALCDDSACQRIREKTLREALGKIVSRCVSVVGVDANKVDEATLSFIAGFTPLSVKNFLEYRKTKGPFRTREQFKRVKGVSDSTFRQCAGFMKIVDGENPLDATWIHPESYQTALALLEKFEMTVDDLRSEEQRAKLGEKTKDADVAALAKELGVGPLALADILSELVTPGQDPREKESYPIFKKSLIKLKDLKFAMELVGVATRVLDYGAFIDFGGEVQGLLHVSRLSSDRISDARDVIVRGDKVKVRVVGIDLAQRRVSFASADSTADDSRPPHRGSRRRDSRAKGSESRERRPRRHSEGERSRDGEARGGARRKRADNGERREGGYGKRRGRDNDRSRPPRTYQIAAAKEEKPLSEEKKSGKEALQGFDELRQFFFGMNDSSSEKK